MQGLQLLTDPLQPVFESLTPASEELPDFVPLAALFKAFTFLVLVSGSGSSPSACRWHAVFEDAVR